MAGAIADGSSINRESTDFRYIAGVEHARELLQKIRYIVDEIKPLVSQHEFDPIGMARKLLREKEARNNFFPSNLTKDPAWPILLELYRCRIDYEETSVTSLSFGAGIPLTTGHRWIEGLRRGGYANVYPSNADNRSKMIEMTDKGLESMSDYLTSICRAA